MGARSKAWAEGMRGGNLPRAVDVHELEELFDDLAREMQAEHLPMRQTTMRAAAVSQVGETSKASAATMRRVK